MLSACAVVAIAAVVAVTAPASPASAASGAWLCSTYADCEALGMGNHGYDTAGERGYWRMYAGHNCTNYAAYLMVKAGLKNARPFSTSGDAWGWGRGMKKKTNDRPGVGSVAWWDGDGKGDKGHVAYVEAVLSDTEIIVSEDAWGGEFQWRVITADGGWPDGFIHFRDEKGDGSVPAYRSIPAGVKVFSDTNRWQQLDPRYLKPGTLVWVQVDYRNSGTADWTGLALGVPSGSSPTASGWTDRPAVQAQPVVETGQVASFGFSMQVPLGAADGTEFTTEVQPVGAGIGWVKYGEQTVTLRADSRDWFDSAPNPWVSGTSTQGEVLTANAVGWSPGPTLGFQWTRNGEPIPGATGMQYRLTDADVAAWVAVTVTADAPGRIPTERSSGGTPVASKWDRTLRSGETLARGEQLVSANTRFALVQTSSGKLAIVDRSTGTPTWSSGKVGSIRTKLRADGNLVSYDRAGDVVWSSGTKKATTAIITDSGKLVLTTPSGRIRWNSARH